MARAVGQPHGAEGPGERVAALGVVGVDIGIHGFEARPLGQEGPAGDAVRDGRVAALQEGDGGADGVAVAREVLDEALHQRRALLLRQRLGAGADVVQPGGREQAQHQLQRQVLLHRVHPA